MINNPMPHNQIGWILILLIVVQISPLQANESAVLATPANKHLMLGKHAYYLEDKEKKWTLEQVSSSEFLSRWQKNTTENPNFGFTESAYWFRVDVEFKGSINDQWIIVLSNPVLEVINFYGVSDGRMIQHAEVGDNHFFTQRSIQHRKYILPVYPEALKSDASKSEGAVKVSFYFRVESTAPLQVPVSLWQQRAFHGDDQPRLIGLGVYYGTMMVIMLYNFFLFIAVRDKSYLYFVMFIGFNALSQGLLDGVDYQYLWQESPRWNDIVVFVFLPLAFAFIWLFTREFLDLKQMSPRLSICALGATAGCFLLFIAGWFEPPYIMVPALGIVSLLTYIGAFLLGVIMWLRGKKEAGIFSLAWASYFVGASIYVLKLFGVLPRTFWTTNAAPIALIVLVNLLSIALAYRFNLERRAKQLAQEAAQAAQQEIFLAEQGQQKEKEKSEVLQQLDKQKTAFFQNISHELRTPLTLILNPLEEESRLKPENKNIEIAEKNSRRLLRLVNQVLDFQKLSAGKMDIKLEPFNLTEFVRVSGDYFNFSRSSKKINFNLTVNGQRLSDSSDDIYIMGSLDGMEKIVFNFLSNALKFTPDGGNIELGIKSLGNKAKIYVADSGVGIKEEDRQQLFQTFSQVDASTTREYEGTGLGLALAKQLSEKMQGLIGVDSAPGKGSTFWCEFSCCEAPQQEVKKALKIRQWLLDDSSASTEIEDESLLNNTGVEKKLSLSDTDNINQDSALVLVIDDLPDMRSLISDRLRGAGYRVVSAEDGEEGLVRVMEYHPDLIITDWMMPRVSGPELIKALRSDPRWISIPVILLTAKTDEESKMQGVEMGADAFLGKPFNDQELVTRVRNLLILKSREKSLEQALDSLQQTRHALLESEKKASLGQMVAGVAHELNTPLGIGVTAMTHLMDETSLLQTHFAGNTLTQEILETYLNSSNELIQMSLTNLQRTTYLIDRFQQTSIHHTEYDNSEFNLRSSLQVWVGSLQSKLDKRNLSLNLVCPGDMNLYSNPGALGQVLTVFVLDSLKYAFEPEDTGQMSLNISQEDNEIKLVYQDNGKGMSEEVVKNIFEPFFTTQRGSRSTGVGMYIAYCIVTQHLEGTIECYSQLGQGAKITVTIPIKSVPIQG